MNKRGSRLTKCILLCFILIMTVSTSYAWYIINTKVSAENINIALVEAIDVEFSTDAGATWQSNFTSGEEIVFDPVLGNGIDFFTYQLETYTVASGDDFILKGSKIKTNTQIAEANYKSYLYHQEFSAKTSLDTGLYLKKDSKISPLNPSDESRINEYGFSRDYIAGAARLAIYQYVEEEWTPILFWIPNSEYQLTKSGDTKTFTVNGTMETSYTFTNVLSGDNATTVFTPDSTNPKKIDGVTYVYGSLTEDLYLFDLTTEENSLIAVSVWIDESDREADVSLGGGLLNIVLNFSAEISKKSDE